jgi:hypothetical protein
MQKDQNPLAEGVCPRDGEPSLRVHVRHRMHTLQTVSTKLFETLGYFHLIDDES